jgi:hypothetical protein
MWSRWAGSEHRLKRLGTGVDDLDKDRAVVDAAVDPLAGR